MTEPKTIPIDYMFDEALWLEFVTERDHVRKLEYISTVLARFLNVPFDMPVNREKVIFKICQYIHENGLQCDEMFKKDACLEQIFPGFHDEYCDEIVKLVDVHFINLQRCKSAPSLYRPMQQMVSDDIV